MLTLRLHFPTWEIWLIKLLSLLSLKVTSYVGRILIQGISYCLKLTTLNPTVWNLTCIVGISSFGICNINKAFYTSSLIVLFPQEFGYGSLKLWTCPFISTLSMRFGYNVKEVGFLKSRLLYRPILLISSTPFGRLGTIIGFKTRWPLGKVKSIWFLVMWLWLKMVLS